MDERALLFCALRSSVSSNHELLRVISEITGSPHPSYQLIRTLQSASSPFLESTPGLNLSILPPSYDVPCRTRFPRRPPRKIVNDRFEHLFQLFVSMPGNSSSPSDFLTFLKSDVSLASDSEQSQFIRTHDFLFGIRPISALYHISNPFSQGEPTAVKEASYQKVCYPMGLPVVTGLRPGDAELLNTKWRCCDQRTSARSSSARQVTGEMATIEDSASAIDQELARANSVYRLLLFNGASAAQMTSVVEDEMKAIYKGMGGHILELLRIRADIALPVILKRLRIRLIDLMKSKLAQSRTLCCRLEQVLVQQRLAHHRKFSASPVAFHLGTKRVHFPIELTYLLKKLIDTGLKYRKAESDSAAVALRTILAELRSASLNVSVSYRHGIVLALASKLLKMLGKCNVIDDAQSSSVKLAIDLGLTSSHCHGFERIMGLLAEDAEQQRVKQIKMELAAVCFEIDVERTNALWQASNLLIKAFLQFVEETGRECKMIKVHIAEGLIDFSRYDMFELDVSHLMDPK
jgi:hypothetical protein